MKKQMKALFVWQKSIAAMLCMALLSTFVLLIVSCSDNKFDTNAADETAISPILRSSVEEEKLAWDFPIRYGTPEWSSLKTVEEQFNAYNIPYGILKQVSTSELIKICMHYPEWGLMHAYNSRVAGFSILCDYFNGFRELLRRDDATLELMNEYKSLDPLAIEKDWTDLRKGEYAFKFTKIEMFLNIPSMIDKLDKEDILNLKEIVISQYNNKRSLLDIYSLWDFSPTVGVAINIIEKENADIFKSMQAEINYFRYYLMSDNLDFLDSIIELLKR